MVQNSRTVCYLWVGDALDTLWTLPTTGQVFIHQSFSLNLQAQMFYLNNRWMTQKGKKDEGKHKTHLKSHIS